MWGSPPQFFLQKHVKNLKKNTFIVSTDKTSTEFTMRKEMRRFRSTLRIAPTDGCLNIWLPDPTHVRDTPTVY